MKRLLLIGALIGAIAAIAIPTASASVQVLPLSAQPNGWTYHQWHAIYNQRFLQRDFRSHHALAATRNGQCGQKVGQAKAWLLSQPVVEGELTARCRIRAGTRLVVDVAGAIDVYGGPERLKAHVAAEFKSIGSPSLTLDGRSLTPHVIQTPFIHAKVGRYNAQSYGLPPGLWSLISRDYFAILSPISRGWHTLRISATYGSQAPSVSTFWLNVR